MSRLGSLAWWWAARREHSSPPPPTLPASVLKAARIHRSVLDAQWRRAHFPVAMPPEDQDAAAAEALLRDLAHQPGDHP